MSVSIVLLALCTLAASLLEVSLSIPMPPEDEFTCIPANFPSEHVCGTLFPNLTSIMSPNPNQINGRQNTLFSGFSPELYFNNSLAEFENFRSLLTGKDQCSNKIATLLCFFYFPSCSEVGYGSEKKRYTVFPCRTLCEEVTALDSECTRTIPKTWGPFFQGCNYTYGEDENGHTRQVYSEKSCANGTHLSYYDIKHPVKDKDCIKLNTSKSINICCIFKNNNMKKITPDNTHPYYFYYHSSCST